MTYQVGGTIQASDINSWLTTMNSVYGVGNGDRGYGQSTLQSNVSVGNTITAAHWTNLRTTISRCATHQGTTATDLVPTNVLDPGDTVYAHVSGSAPNNFNFGSMVTAVDTNRLNAVSNMSLTAAASSLTKAASWTAATSCTVDCVFTDENHARYFFNTGGEIRVRLVATGTLSSSNAAQDIDWRDIITNKVGTFTIKARSSSRSGSAGTINNGGGGSQGFYGLNTTSTTIYNGGNIGGGAYTANDVFIKANVRNVVGTNGGNGNTIRFQIDLSDDHSNAFYDQVSSGMQVVFDYYKVGTANLPVAIAGPTFSTVTAWT